MSRERPIIFSGAMVRAILDGRKTQTRRVVKLRHGWTVEERDDGSLWPRYSDYVTGGEWDGCVPCPFGATGDQLWVRETFAIVPRTAYARSEGVQQALRRDDPCGHDAAIYRAGWTRSTGGFKWRSPIHMPRWASRITLDVLDVRVKRLHEITEDDARAEGVEPCGGFMASAGCWTNYAADGPSLGTARESFRTLWDSIHGHGSWHANPWVWALEFRRVAR